MTTPMHNEVQASLTQTDTSTSTEYGVSFVSDYAVKRFLMPNRWYWEMREAFWRVRLVTNDVLIRIFDILSCSVAVILLSPLFLLLFVLIHRDSPGAALYQQSRVGLRGKLFSCYKLRTMYVGSAARKAELLGKNESKDGILFKMTDDPRITRIGRWLRKNSLDELPQLFNVILGDMSLVGPRPALPSEVAQYSLDAYKRLHVKPGITCFWQISGRSLLSFKQQVRLDRNYIQQRSFWLNIKILFLTIPAVIKGEGAY